MIQEDSDFEIRSYQLKVKGLPVERGEINTKELANILLTLCKTAESVTRLLLFGSGSGKGLKPSWLAESTNFTVTGLTQGSTVIGFKAPVLRETSRNNFPPKETWLNPPGSEDTALDLVAYAIEDVGNDNSTGEYYDSYVLEAMRGLGRTTHKGGVQLELMPQDPTRGKFIWNKTVNQKLNNLVKSIPKPQTYIVSGQLEQINYKNGNFHVTIDSNSKILGKLQSDSLDVEVLRQFWGKPVTIEGMVHFKVDGKPKVIEARNIDHRSEGDEMFEELPEIRPLLSKTELYRAQSFNIRDIVGTWPGDESIEELMATLKEIS